MKTLKIFILILVLCLVSVILSPWLGFEGLNVSDAKWEWIRTKIYETPHQTIDYVLIGSSRTWCAVKSRQIEHALEPVSVWNFGRHWTGRDIDYLIIKALLEHHDVKHIFVEMIGQEDFAPHPLTKYIIAPDEVAAEADYHFKNVRAMDVLTYSANLKERIKHLLNYSAELSMRAYRVGVLSVWSKIFPGEDFITALARHDESGGFYVDDSQLTQKKEFAQQFGRFQPFYPVSKGPYMIPPGTYPDYYLRKINDVCRRKNAELSFVFVSDFAAVLPHDQMFDHFSQWGPIYIPTLRHIYKAEYWRDKNHLYQKGSVVFTSEIISLLKNGVRSSEEYLLYEQR